MKSRRHVLWSALVMALVVGVVAGRAATLLRYDLWYDELYSVFTALGDLGQLWQASVADRVHPPLFYIVLWGWLKVVEPTPTLLRLLPLVGFVLALGATWWAAGRIGLTSRGRAVATLAVALNPIAFDAGADLRGYALLAALVAVMIGAMHPLRPEPDSEAEPEHRHLALLIAAAIGATWTHYFAWPTVVAVAVVLVLNHRRRDAALLLGITALAFAPWLAALLGAEGEQTAAQIGWGNTLGLHDALLLPGTLLAGRTPLIAMAVAAVIGWMLLVTALKRTPSRELALLVAAPPAAVVVASLTLGLAIWEPRYLIGAVPPLALLLAMWSDSISPLPRIAAVALLGLSAWGAVTPADWRIPWKGITRDLAERSDGQPVYAFDGFSAIPIRYYARMEGLRLNVPEIKQWPDATTAPGWLLLRPAVFPNVPSAAARLRESGRVVVDSMESGVGTNRVEAWRFR